MQPSRSCGFRQDDRLLRVQDRATGLFVSSTNKPSATKREILWDIVNEREIAVAHVATIEEKIRELESMRRTLNRLITACHGDDRPDCPILDDLAGEPGGNGSQGG
jgi:hypothetical protein